MLPPSLSPSRWSARLWLALAAGVGCGVCAYAGLYPRFDDGKLRLVLALSCAPFGAAVVAAALSAKSAEGAVARALLLSSLLGVAAVVLPAALLATQGSPEFFAAAIFGAFFGAPTGALYGLPLAVLAGPGFRHVHAPTHEGTDRAIRLGGVWLVMVSLVGLLGTLLLDGPKTDWETGVVSMPSPVPWLLAIAAAASGIAVAVHGGLRLRRRSAWLGRVRVGLEPTFRVRAVEVRDELGALPRVSEGAEVEVVEWCPDELGASAGTAYRAAAVGTAVALVRDERPSGPPGA